MAAVGTDPEFTTRPELRGRFGMVSSTHWLASATGLRMLELGGNAFDAVVAAGLVLQVVQPHLNGAGGDLPVVLWDARRERPEVLCAQGVAPAAATPGAFGQRGLAAIPGVGVVAACVPGAMDGWFTLLHDRGSLPLRTVVEPAIDYARHGFPVSAGLTRTIASIETRLAGSWPDTAAIYLPDGRVPAAGTTLTNQPLADTYERLVAAGEAAGDGRAAQIRAARDAFYRGFVAAAIGRFVRAGSADEPPGLLTADDLAAWHATWEDPVSLDFRGVTVCKAGPWSQGPVLLQQLALLDGLLADDTVDRLGADYVHTIVEASKLAFADREAWYTDPSFGDVPLATLLSAQYAARRRSLVGARASLEQRPGSPDGRVPHLPAEATDEGTAGSGEPTVRAAASHGKGPHDGDTCHVDVVDRFGNVVAATPSGGWLQSSPAIPGLGFPLGTRMQMFDLAPDTPNRVAPGRRPRTTLSPSLALRDGRPWLAFGTPGGDQQDQWQLQFLLNVVLFGDDLQLAIDRPVFHSAHFRSSFAPRTATPGRIYLEDRFPAETIAELRRRGHDVVTTPAWSLTRLCAVARTEDGVLCAGANPRGMEGYAMGR